MSVLPLNLSPTHRHDNLGSLKAPFADFTPFLTIVLKEEIETTMRNMGVTSLEQLNPSYVNVRRLEQELLEDLSLDISRCGIKANL